MIKWLRTLQEYGYHFQYKAQVQDICDGFRELGLSREEYAELDQFSERAPKEGPRAGPFCTVWHGWPR